VPGLWVARTPGTSAAQGRHGSGVLQHDPEPKKAVPGAGAGATGTGAGAIGAGAGQQGAASTATGAGWWQQPWREPAQPTAPSPATAATPHNRSRETLTVVLLGFRPIVRRTLAGSEGSANRALPG